MARRFLLENSIDDILGGKININYSQSFKNIIIKKGYLEFKCKICDIKEWNNKPISLELDHIDGDRNNNKLENLRILCPNCHSQTPTWKNKRNLKKNILENKQIIIDKFKKGESVNSILNSLKLNNGHNYKVIEKILNEDGLSYKKEKTIDIKKISLINTENRINDKIDKINNVLNSGIDFKKKGWGVLLSKILKITPQASIKFVKREIPELYNLCFKHSS